MFLCINSVLNVRSDHQCLTTVILWHSVGVYKNCLGTRLKTIRYSFRLLKFLMFFLCQIVLTVCTCDPLKLLLVPSKNYWKSYSPSIFFRFPINPIPHHQKCRCIWCELTENPFKDLIFYQNTCIFCLTLGSGTKIMAKWNGIVSTFFKVYCGFLKRRIRGAFSHLSG